MRFESVTLSDLCCFGTDAITVPLSAEITAVVGPTAAGKIALLRALAKLFAISRVQRAIDRSNFRLAADVDPDDRDPKELVIDVLIALPELADGTATPETVAPSFRRMLITRKDKPPVCRLQLDACWVDDGTVEGEVSQELYWIDTLEEALKDDKKHAVQNSFDMPAGTIGSSSSTKGNGNWSP